VRSARVDDVLSTVLRDVAGRERLVQMLEADTEALVELVAPAIQAITVAALFYDCGHGALVVSLRRQERP
jgi:hypothetical protein